MAVIVSYWVNLANDKRSLKDLAKLALDETSFKRGHDYVTLMIDAEERCVVDIEDGMDKDTVANFRRKLVEKGGNPANITAVTSDMSKSFCTAIAENFPNASHVIDKFHVTQIVTTSMDEVRKLEQKDVDGKKCLFRSRRLFMVPQAKPTEEQTANLAVLSKHFPKTGKTRQILASSPTG